MPNQVIRNILIAAGTLLIGSASTLTRPGYGQFLYLGELLCRSTIHSNCPELDISTKKWRVAFEK